MKNIIVIDDRPNNHPDVVEKMEKMWEARSPEEKAEIDAMWESAMKKLNNKKQKN